jgi:hypothetical protein
MKIANIINHDNYWYFFAFVTISAFIGIFLFNDDSMDKCLVKHSYETCHSQLFN